MPLMEERMLLPPKDALRNASSGLSMPPSPCTPELLRSASWLEPASCRAFFSSSCCFASFACCLTTKSLASGSPRCCSTCGRHAGATRCNTGASRGRPAAPATSTRAGNALSGPGPTGAGGHHPVGDAGRGPTCCAARMSSEQLRSADRSRPQLSPPFEPTISSALSLSSSDSPTNGLPSAAW